MHGCENSGCVMFLKLNICHFIITKESLSPGVSRKMAALNFPPFKPMINIDHWWGSLPHLKSMVLHAFKWTKPRAANLRESQLYRLLKFSFHAQVSNYFRSLNRGNFRDSGHGRPKSLNHNSPSYCCEAALWGHGLSIDRGKALYVEARVDFSLGVSISLCINFNYQPAGWLNAIQWRPASQPWPINIEYIES